MYTRAGKWVRMFELSFVCCAFKAKFLFSATHAVMFANLQLSNLNMLSIMWACSRKVEAIHVVFFCHISQSNDDKYK